jgi:DNA-binding transcriptional MerR regulator
VSSYAIAEAAVRCGLTVHTLRWYERIGLLDRVARGADGRRRFTDDDLGFLEFVVRLRRTGMPVAEMIRYAELVRAGDPTGAARLALLQEHRERVREQVAALTEHLDVLDWKIDNYRRVLRQEEEEIA